MKVEARKTLFVPASDPIMQNQVLWVKEFQTQPAKAIGNYAIRFKVRGIEYTLGCQIELPCYTEEIAMFTRQAKTLAMQSVQEELKAVIASIGEEVE